VCDTYIEMACAIKCYWLAAVGKCGCVEWLMGFDEPQKYSYIHMYVHIKMQEATVEKAQQ